MLRQLIHSEEVNIRNEPRSMNQHRSCSLCLWRDVCCGISDPRTQKKVDYNVCVWLLQVNFGQLLQLSRGSSCQKAPKLQARL